MEMTRLDWAGIAALLGVVGAAARWVWVQFSVGSEGRERRLAEREAAYVAKTENKVAVLEEKVKGLEKSNGLLMDILRVVLAELVHLDPRSPTLALLSTQLKAMYPTEADVPFHLQAVLDKIHETEKKNEDTKPI